ncbi:MAG: hypothetical protein DWQ34_06020 [Planctomycetota bacterium]|nr:MAG: hypothetical protein DWQ34_06020 [Planctomycetota bacterium]
MFPVSGPGGLELLKDGLEDEPADEYAPGNKVFVAQENAELRVLDQATGEVDFGEIVEIADVDGEWLWIPEKNGWIHQHDIIPLKSNVTRIVDADPPTGLDRTHPLYYDHPHHKGIWLSIDEVNGIRFWAEDGVIRNVGVEILEEQGDPARFRVTNHWLGEDEKPVAIETTTISVFANRLLVYDITFAADEKPVTFDDTKEGLFGIRLPNSMREFISEGPITGADGVVGSAELWGKPAAWIDYVGAVDGHSFGVTLMDHPENFRPSRYHVRDYGLFSINPFGEAAYSRGDEEAKPVTLQPGETLNLRYGLYVHAGGVEEGQVAEAYEQFVAVEEE